VNKVRVAVLASGSGSNLAALIAAAKDPAYPVEIALVVSDKERAFALERARAADIPTVWIGRKGHASRRAYDQAMVDVLMRHEIQWVALAGFMRIVTTTFLEAFPNRVVNIHPSLLPAFPGLDAQGQAFSYGVKVTGATVHFVDAGTDTGPIIEQRSVPAYASDTEDELKARILSIEHELYPTALAAVVGGELVLQGRKVVPSR
jgi:phosphoribosylglycinamide formyltransferase-1